ncbi:MAG: hypothetical protein GXP54_07025 [Deltaproteobacteria bacterium]|nr:hypothetical protein [Deltaproteobacteria bacterium]
MPAISNFDIIVFDMEDALIDHSNSMCAAVSRAIDTYLVSLLGIRPEGGPVINPHEILEFSRVQGFDKGEDVMDALLAAALNWLPVDMAESDFDDLDGRDLLLAVSKRPEMAISLGDVAAKKNLAEFNKLLRSRGSGKRGMGRLRGLKNSWMALCEGHIMMDNFSQRILKEAFLGDKLFMAEHGQQRQFVTDIGAIEMEKPWISPHDLAYIRKRCPLATITSRSRTEAQFVLDRLDLRRYLDVVVSRGSMGMGMEDPEEARWIRSLGVAETTGADYPTRVTEAIGRIRNQEAMQSIVRVAYVGNCAIDDRGIARLKERNRLTAIGCAFGQDHKAAAAQKEKGADMVVHDPHQLSRVLTERPRLRSSYHRRRR